jgi:cytochrome P450
VEFERYMKELVWEKRHAIAKGDNAAQMDVLSPIIRSVYGIPNNPNDDKATPTLLTDALTESELMADAFMFLFAGHESSATTIYFCLLYLALNPLVQQDLQSSLDMLLSNRPLGEWTYDQDLPALLTGMAGAVMNEVLRLMPPFMYVPKITPVGEGSQGLVLDGKKVVVPEDCQISIVLPAAHRNPNYWPTEGGAADDLDTFRPRRWFTTIEANHITNEKPTELFRPPRGAFLPFSDGPRSCIGRRFAQIEIVAVLASIFLTHSIELSVSAFASDVVVDRMPLGGTERKEVWEKAASKARERLPLGIENSSIATISRGDLRGIGLRVVQRGEERFRGFL